VTLGTTVNALLSRLENEVLEVVAPNGRVITGTAAVTTGTRINLYDNGALVDSVVVGVTGDLDGNGVIDSTDYLRVKGAFLKQYELTAAEDGAADVDGNGRVDSTDYLRIKEHFLGTYEL
jgi:hypothetical protein